LPALIDCTPVKLAFLPGPAGFPARVTAHPCDTADNQMDEAGDSPGSGKSVAEHGFRLNDQTYSFGPFRFSATLQQLTLDGKPVRLGSRAIAILSALVERPGEVVSKEDLLTSAWPRTHVEEGNLRVHIAALRRALGDSSDEPKYILNVAGRGYRFVASVRRFEVPGGQVAPLDGAAAPSSDNLPGLIGHIIGREDDLDALAVMLEQSRQVTLAGAGGIGKTTVALALAHRMKHRFGGSFFVDLAAVSDPAVVPFAIASAVRIAIDTERPVESLVGRLRADRALLVFDNCEHLIDAAALVAESLLKGANGIRILATSHEPLRIEGERVYRLAPFDLPPGAETLPLHEALHLPAIELFVEHMMANDDAFTIGDADVPFIVEICRRLDGLPLAIEIAASRAGALGIAELAERLDDRFGILTGGRRTAATRHQTLRNMLDWSHDNLGERDRIVLRRLAVFAGEFSLDAAALVAGDERLNAATVTDGVSDLVRKSLLMQSSKGGASSFRMLDSTRLYALEKLEAAGEIRRVRDLHVHYLCDVLRQAEVAWNMTPVPTWTATYDRFIDDIRTAVSWAFSAAGNEESGIILTSLALPLAMQLGLHDEFRERMFLAMDRARQLPNGLTVPELRLHLARNAFTYNVGQQVDVTLERAVELAELTGKDRHRMEPLVQISSTHVSLGQYEAAVANGARALALAHSCGDELAVLSASRAMAQAAHYAGRHGRAMELATAVLRHPVRNIPYTYGFMHTDRRISMRWVLVRSLWMSGRGDEAVRVADEGVVIAKEAGAVALAQFLGMAVVPMLLWRGDHAAARELTDKLFEHSERYSFKYWKAWCAIFYDVIAWHEEGRAVTPVSGVLETQTLSTLVGLAAPLPPSINMVDWSAPELIRLRGERLVAQGKRKAGEADIVAAAELARQHGAIAWELRCAISLARLWRSGPRRVEGAEKLASMLDQLPEGHNTADPTAARNLLGQLR
jgi:predicted ATPase/DNA-binding winged helix-turn-helix (wHTH) protein